MFIAQDADSDDGQLYYQIRVSHQLSQPLVTGFYFKCESRKVWVSIKYEKLPFLFSLWYS